MIKRDRIFYSACGLTGVGLVLTVMGYELSLLLFMGAYLLRPALREFGLAKQQDDEYRLEIHSRSVNLAFMVVMIAMIGAAIWRLSDGESPVDLYALLGIGLAIRAVTSLAMAAEYRKAAVVMISAVGAFHAWSIVLDNGVSKAAVIGIAIGVIFIGFAQLARKSPKPTAIILAIFAVIALITLVVLGFRRVDMDVWLLFVAPITTASICLFLDARNEEQVISTRVRLFGSLGIGMIVVFALMLIAVGSKRDSIWRTTADGEITEVQGIATTGQIEYYANGNIKWCGLAREDTLSGQPLPARTGVHFTEDGVFEWCFLPRTTEIQGYLCRGSGVQMMTRFYPNGQVQYLNLAEDQVIQGIPCARARFLFVVLGGVDGKSREMLFHENGQLKQCPLSKNTTIQGRNFRRGDVVRFDPDGRLIAESEAER